MARLLIIDDETDITDMLCTYFRAAGYDVHAARSGKEALLCLREPMDLILLDISMPDMDGIEVCKRIREFVSCPILFLTAKGTDADIIHGFAVGGDDYIVKPFGLNELGARVAAHLRREARDRQTAAQMCFESDLSINFSAKAVYAGGERIPLAKKEFEILEFLCANAGQVFDRERIYERLWGWDSEGDSAVVTEHIRRIRAKLTQAGCKNHIETVWGMGYKWVR